MQRVLFDTNIYGCIADEPQPKKLTAKIRDNKNLIIYGCNIVRKEIKRTGNKKTRNGLLELYDHLTTNKNLLATEKAEKLAKEYQKEAKKIGKNKVKSWNQNYEDFIIIAVATLNKLNIVFTNDIKTMLGEYNVQAYRIVNLRKDYNPPVIYTYNELKSSFG